MIGNIVQSKAGRDKGRNYIVIKAEKEFIFLADGDVRKLDNLKRKKPKHITVTGKAEILVEKLTAGRIIYDAEIKKYLRGNNV